MFSIATVRKSLDVLCVDALWMHGCIMCVLHNHLFLVDGSGSSGAGGFHRAT